MTSKQSDNLYLNSAFNTSKNPIIINGMPNIAPKKVAVSKPPTTINTKPKITPIKRPVRLNIKLITDHKILNGKNNNFTKIPPV